MVGVGNDCRNTSTNKQTNKQANTMNTIDNSAIIESASAIIAAAAKEAVTAITTAKAALAIVIRDQAAILQKAGVSDREIARIVRDAVAGSCTPSHISRTLTACGIRLRGKRSDSGFLRLSDGALTLCHEAKPEPAAAAAGEGEGEGDDGDADCLIEDGTKGSGHTPETLASLLASIDPAIVKKALKIAGLA
jgi:hypothetical protein